MVEGQRKGTCRETVCKNSGKCNSIQLSVAEYVALSPGRVLNGSIITDEQTAEIISFVQS